MVDGPAGAGRATYSQTFIPAASFRRAVADAADYVRNFNRLPNEVFVGAESLSLADFTATLAGGTAADGNVPVAHGSIEFNGYFATDPLKSFSWVIHSDGFDGSPLLELAQLQGWTLKPARPEPNSRFTTRSSRPSRTSAIPTPSFSRLAAGCGRATMTLSFRVASRKSP